MATNVDPFLIQIPMAFRKDPEVFAWAQYTSKFLHDLRARVIGATDTDVSELETNLNQLLDLENTGMVESALSEIQQLKKRIEALERNGYA